MSYVKFCWHMIKNSLQISLFLKILWNEIYEILRILILQNAYTGLYQR